MSNLVTADYDSSSIQIGTKEATNNIKNSINFVQKKTTVICTYFPGWCTPNGGGPQPTDPWGLISTYTPERKPVLGYYDETSQQVMDTQFTWMKKFGIDVINLDWFMQFSGNALVPLLEHVLQLYKSSKVDKPKLMLQFANQTNGGSLNTIAKLEIIWKFFVDSVFPIPGYYTVNNCPVIMWNSLPTFKSNMTGITHATIAASLQRFKDYAITKGWGGVQIMAGQADSSDAWTSVNTKTNRWDGVAATNIFYKTKEADQTPGPTATSYAELHAAIHDGVVGNYRGFLYGWTRPSVADVGYIWVPIQMGWNKKPWNGGVVDLDGEPTDPELMTHLVAAKNYVDTYPDKTQNTVIIQAWNEAGEGNRCQPELATGFKYLEFIRDIFAR